MQLIIDHPSLVPLPRRLGWGLVTIVFWAVWVYLWVPFLTLAAWSFGFYQAYNHFHWEREVMELKRLLVLYAIIITIFGGALLLWATSEYLRFRFARRRSSSLPVPPQELAQYTGLSAEHLIECQRLRCVVAYHDEHGAMLGAEHFGDEFRP